MEDNPALETWLRKLLSPIIDEAVEKAFARHYSAPIPSPTDDNEILDVKRTAELLLLSVPTIYGLVHKRSIPHSKRGKRLYFRKGDLLKWIESNRRMTTDELYQQADKYILSNRRRR